MILCSLTITTDGQIVRQHSVQPLFLHYLHPIVKTLSLNLTWKIAATMMFQLLSRIHALSYFMFLTVYLRLPSHLPVINFGRLTQLSSTLLSPSLSLCCIRLLIGINRKCLPIDLFCSKFSLQDATTTVGYFKGKHTSFGFRVQLESLEKCWRINLRLQGPSFIEENRDELFSSHSCWDMRYAYKGIGPLSFSLH